MKDIEKLDNLPQRLSMRHTHYKESYTMKMYDQGVQNYKIVGRYIDRYLEKSIGKNFDKVKKHILEKMKDFNLARNESNIVESSLSWKVGDGKFCKYVIDSQGRLQKSKTAIERTEYWRKKKREKTTQVVLDDTKVTYRLKPDLSENDIVKLKQVLASNGVPLGGWFEHICCGGSITQEKYSYLIYKVPERIVGRDKWNYPIWSRKNRDYIESCFEVDNGVLVYNFVYNSPEHKQWKKEQQDKKNKAYRERKKIQEQQLETLLYDIEERAKRKEREKNIVDRDRLGFNEDSFMGEPYHGQKRKKRVQ